MVTQDLRREYASLELTAAMEYGGFVLQESLEHPLVSQSTRVLEAVVQGFTARLVVCLQKSILVQLEDMEPQMV